MKHYKMQMSVRMIEVATFDEPEETPDPAAAPPYERESVDPVRKMDKLQEKSVELLDKMMKNAERGNPMFPVSQPPLLPESEISLLKVYDVPTESLEAAAALLKRFEETAAQIGIPAKGILPPHTHSGFYVGG